MAFREKIEKKKLKKKLRVLALEGASTTPKDHDGGSTTPKANIYIYIYIYRNINGHGVVRPPPRAKTFYFFLLLFSAIGGG
jgi:hypothetical protein